MYREKKLLKYTHFNIHFPSKKASEYFTDSPDLSVNEPVMHFAQIGPPRNVTVEQTDAGDEFVVTWYPPEYGLETLRVYVVRWFREPGHLLIGSAETRETYYKGNYYFALSSSSITFVKLLLF